MSTAPPLLFVQHGWADRAHSLARLASWLAPPETTPILPNLGPRALWGPLERLVDRVEEVTGATLARDPTAPLWIVGHSLGGVIWLELLERHPEWWPRVEGVLLLGVPLGGVARARWLGSLGVTLGRELAADRRTQATRLAAQLPLLLLAGEQDTVAPLARVAAPNVPLICVPSTDHRQLRSSWLVALLGRQFFARLAPPPTPTAAIAERLAALGAPQPCPPRRLSPALLFRDGTTLRFAEQRHGSWAALVTPSGVLQVATRSEGRSTTLRRCIQALRREQASLVLWAAPWTEQ
jgi:pimeloyl-ACP methyl ester carboxylesterase